MNRSRAKKIVEKLPVFRGLSPSRMQKVLEVCSEQVFKAGQTLCAEGDKSSEFYVVLSGSLRVATSAGLALAVIRRMGVVGEMGMLTGRPRSAAVVAAEDTTVLRIGKEDLDRVIDADKEIGLHIYRNLAQILCDRLRDSNAYLEQYFHAVEDLTAHPTV